MSDKNFGIGKREIKFRGKRRDNGEWVYGALVRRNNDGYKRAYIYDEGWDETEIDEYSTDSKLSLKECFIEVDLETVGQYTGLKDKNGKEIYCGDRIKGKDSDGEEMEWVVKFRDGGFEPFTCPFNRVCELNIEVVGNVFERNE